MAKEKEPAAPSPNETRALACAPCTLRENILSNLRGNAYSRPEDIEADLLDLERRDAANK